VTRFVKEWDDIYKDCKIKAVKKTRRVPKYIIKIIRKYVRVQEEYEKRDWENLKKILLREYRQKNII
jgi:ribosomal protein L39E